MTYEKAYAYFTHTVTEIPRSYTDKAIEALEKQIPKKPKKETVQVNGYDHGCDDYCYTEESCPSCNLSISRGVSYCPHCGQVLDWTEE